MTAASVDAPRLPAAPGGKTPNVIMTSRKNFMTSQLFSVLVVRRPVRESHFSGLTRQVGRRVFHGIGWGVHGFQPGINISILRRGSCSPNKEQLGGGNVAPTVSLHCILFSFRHNRSKHIAAVFLFRPDQKGGGVRSFACFGLCLRTHPEFGFADVVPVEVLHLPLVDHPDRKSVAPDERHVDRTRPLRTEYSTS